MTRTIKFYAIAILIFFLVIALKLSLKSSLVFNNIVFVAPLLFLFAFATILQMQVSNFVLFFIGLFVDTIFKIPLGMGSCLLIFINLLCVFYNQFIFIKINYFINFLFFIIFAFIAFLFLVVLTFISDYYSLYIFKSIFKLYALTLLLYPIVLLMFYLARVIVKYRYYGEE